MPDSVKRGPQSRSGQGDVPELGPISRGTAPGSAQRASMPGSGRGGTQVSLPSPVSSNASDDDEDLEIEHSAANQAVGGRWSEPEPSRAAKPKKVASGLGLDLGTYQAPELLPAGPGSARQHEVRSHRLDRRSFSLLGNLGRGTLLVILAGLAGAGLFFFLHRTTGFRPVLLLPHAFDGTSAKHSGGVSVASLLLASGLAIRAAFAPVRSLGYAVAAAAMLLAAIAMITVTLSVNPEFPPAIPPDGGQLFPWLLPVVPLGMGLRMAHNAWIGFAEDTMRERALSLVYALLVGAFAFGAFELGVGLMQ